MLNNNINFESDNDITFNYKRNKPVLKMVLDAFRNQGYIDIADADNLSFVIDDHGYVTDINFNEVEMSMLGYTRLMSKWFASSKDVNQFSRIMALKDSISFVFDSKWKYTNFDTNISDSKSAISVSCGSADWELCVKVSQFMDSEIEKIVKASIKSINSYINNTTVKDDCYLVKQHILTNCRVDVCVVTTEEVFGLRKKELSLLCKSGCSGLICTDIKIDFYGLDGDAQSRTIRSQCGSCYVDIVKSNMTIVRDCLHEMVMQERENQGLEERENITNVVSFDDSRMWRSLGI